MFLLLGGCSLWRPVAPVASFGDRTVYVVGRGYHTDIGFETAGLTGALAGLAARFPAARTLLVGFGDRTFVTTRDKWLGTWLLTLWPGKGAMLVTGLRGTPEAAFGPAHVVRLRVSEASYAGVTKFVGGSFALERGAPVFLGRGPYLGSLFYASTRTYDLLDTCNTWSAAALRSGGLDAPVGFTLFAGQTMRAARRLAGEGY